MKTNELNKHNNFPFKCYDMIIKMDLIKLGVEPRGYPFGFVGHSLGGNKYHIIYILYICL